MKLIRPWIELQPPGRVVGFFPQCGVSKGDVVLADDVRSEVVRVDHRRNRIKVRPKP